MKRRKVIWMAAAAAALGAYALLVGWTGGFDVRLAGVRVRSRAWERPAILAAAGSAWLLYVRRREVIGALARVWAVADHPRGARVLAGLGLTWTLAAGLMFGTFASGGADSYGYVGQARLLLAGRLTDTVPVRAAFSWPDAAATLIPLGFTSGTAAGVIAPRYPPGLSVLMAPFALVSEQAIYLLVPLFGAVAVWLIYRLGAELGDPLAGGVAALLLAASPTFLYQLVQPMSDVPTMACWLGALLMASRRTVASAAAAGALSSVAVMIRPNLVPLAVLILVQSAFADRALRRPRAAAFVTALAPGLVALGWIQHVRYGSPFASGYGSIDEGFSAANITPNLVRYPRWLTESHTPFIWVSLLAPFWIARRAARRRLAWVALLLSIAVWGAYLPYAYFQLHEWFYTRFLLTSIALMLLFAAAISLALLRRLPPAVCTAVAGLLLVAQVATLVQSARSRQVFELRRQESKYPLAGAFAREQLPLSAFILAAQHSGSIRYYANRPTLRWDLLGASHLDEALAALRAAGFEPFAVLDADEDLEFRRKFGAAGEHARLTPLAVLGGTRVYGFR
jgi:hypothetical protein